MPLDRTTDAIAHFIGLFHLDAEAARMRESYDAFRAHGNDLPPPNDLPDITVSIRAPYEVDKFGPGLNGLPLAPKLPDEAAAALSEAPARNAPAARPGWEPLPATEPAVLRLSADVPDPHWQVPLPNSIMTVTVQSHWMSDNDHLDFGLDYAFVAPAFFTAELADLIETAKGLSLGLSDQMTPGEVPAVNAIKDLIATAANLEALTIEGARVSVLQGEAAQGIVIDGTAATELPDFDDNLPQAMREDEPEPEPEAADAPPPPGFPGAEPDAPNPYVVDPGHNVMAGGNLMVNETHIGSVWVDAPVIAVMGDVARIDLISQTNVLRDIDSGASAGTSSAAVNAAQIKTISSVPEGEPAQAANAILPSHWEVVRVEGDVIAVNWVEQHSFATDHDRAEIVFSGSNTWVGLGDNTLYNLTSLIELGFHYDLIMVGGSMVSMNLIEQVNVLLDTDFVSGTLGAADMISGGDNYLLNSAIISTTGIDTTTAMTDAFHAAGEAFAEGAQSITAQLAAEPLFSGMATLSVLYVEGDLIKLHAISQVNYLGDADQVHLALDGFIAGAGDDITVTTGSNAMLNAARINDIGLDSTVLAGGEVYSAALIHQAGLIDTDAMPDGVTMAALTSDAVAAFLSGDMIGPAAAAEDADTAPPAIMDGGSLDVMQSYLA